MALRAKPRKRQVSNLPPKGKYPDRTLGERQLMARGARRAAIITEEHRHAARWHYLSFADDSGFLGGVIVRSYGFLTAIQRATDLGINPGGEVMSTPIRERISGEFQRTCATGCFQKTRYRTGWKGEGCVTNRAPSPLHCLQDPSAMARRQRGGLQARYRSGQSGTQDRRR